MSSLNQRWFVVNYLLIAILIGCQDAPVVTPTPRSSVSSSDELPTAPRRSSSIAEGFRREAAPTRVAPVPTNVRLVDRASEFGVDHIYRNGVSGNRLMVEATGGGCGWIDFDRDGWSDL